MWVLTPTESNKSIVWGAFENHIYLQFTIVVCQTPLRTPPEILGSTELSPA